MTDTQKLAMLMAKIDKDPALAKKLGIVQMTKGSYKNPHGKHFPKTSPLRTRKISVSVLPPARSPAVVAPVQETPNEGASSREDSSTPIAPEISVENVTGIDESEDQDIPVDPEDPDSSVEVDDLAALEEILNRDSSDQDSSSHSSDEYEILGGSSKPSWKPSEKSLKWYKEVADLELKKEVLDNIKETFKTADDLNSHFEPPKFPSSLWTAVQTSSADTFRLKSLYKSQENLYLAIKPLLASLDSSPKEVRKNILTSIQLIASSNLSLNRFRRATLAPHLKPEIRKQVLALPVSHNSFFGEEFNKAADTLLKEQSAIEKVLYKKPHKPSTSRDRPQFKQNARNFDQPQPFRGRGKPSQRGGRGKRGNFSRKPANAQINYQASSSTNPSQPQQ